MTYGDYIHIISEKPELDLVQVFSSYLYQNAQFETEISTVLEKLSRLAVRVKALREDNFLPDSEPSKTEDYLLALVEFNPSDYNALLNMNIIDGFTYIALRGISVEIANRKREEAN